MKYNSSSWGNRFLDMHGVAYLMKLIRMSTASKSDIVLINKLLRQKVDKKDVRIIGDQLIIGKNSITIPQHVFMEITREDVEQLFENEVKNKKIR